MVKHRNKLNCTMELTTTFWTRCTHMDCPHHPTWRLQILAQCLVAKGFVHLCVLTTASTVPSHTDGINVTCLVWASIWLTSHKNHTDTFLVKRYYLMGKGNVRWLCVRCYLGSIFRLKGICELVMPCTT